MRDKAAKLWKALHAIESGGHTLLGYTEKIATHREAVLDAAVYQEATLLPEGAVAMKYLDARKFLLAEIESLETRQVYYGNKLEPLVYNLRIFWIDQKEGLGYGMADDLQHKRILWFRFGTPRKWFLYENRHHIRKKTKEGKAQDDSITLL